MKSKNKNGSDRKYLFILLFIVLFGAVLRLFKLSTIPASLNWDEISHGYNAFSILKTGKDQWGQFLPLLNFRAYGDYPLPLNLYLTVPFVAVLGLTEFSIRFPHALLGIGTIIATYFFVLGLTKKRKLALLTCFLVAIDPWTVFTSRFVLQSNLSIFLTTLSAAFFFNRDKKKYFLPLSILFLGLTLYSYHTTRIISPLILLAAIVIFWKKIKITWVSIVIGLLLFIPGIYAVISPQGQARSNVVFLLNDAAVNKIISLRQESKLPDTLNRIIYNRPTYFAWNFTSHYLDYFSPEYLFLNGGTQYQFSVPGFGLLQIASLPFFYIGLIYLAKGLKEKKGYQLVAAWLFLAPIPAAVTVDRFAVVRSTSMLPVVELVAALGFIGFIEFLTSKGIKLAKPTLWILFLTGLLYGLQGYMTSYTTDYTSKYSWSWQYGYKDVVNFAKENYKNYDKIIVTKKYGEPHEFFLFYLKWDPYMYQHDDNSIKFYQSNWYWVDRFDKFWFVNDWQVKDLVTESKIDIDCKNEKCLLITSPENYPSGWHKVGDLKFLDGSAAFEYYDNISLKNKK